MAAGGEQMKMIGIADEQWGIGYQGKLLYSLSEDMARFKKITTGKIVVMGRKTLESLPGRKPLSNRKNIILSTTINKVEGATVYSDLETLLNAIKNEDVFIIGGEQIYHLFLPYADTIYLTKVFAVHQADTFFPNIDQINHWHIKEKSELKEENGIEYQFIEYIRFK